MPLHSTPPTIATREVTTRLVAKRIEQQTLGLFRNIVLGLLLLHALLTLSSGGARAYGASWRMAADVVVAHPWLGLLVPGALVALYVGLDMWRNPQVGEVRLPAYPPVDDLRFNNDIYIGSGWTQKGKQPGEVFDPEQDELLGDKPHVILKESGLFGNLHVKGGIGGGKTSTLIMPYIWQGISKFPKPPHPDTFTLGANGRYPSAAQAARTRRSPLAAVASVFPALGGAPNAGAAPAGAPAGGPIPDGPWLPYAGLTRAGAMKRYEELYGDYERKRWGLFVIDPKGDMTAEIRRMAALAGRADDVVVLQPDGEYTYNALQISSNPLVQSEMVMDGIEAVAGQAIQQYWRQTQSEWLANALTILGVVDPLRKNFKSILKFARSESIRAAMVAEAEAIMRQAQEEEERCRRLGREYTGLRVNPAAIDFFKQWDDPDTDAKQKQAVVSGIQAQAKFFVEDELASFLCPEMPATFEGFDAMMDRGQIVVLRMPLGKWSAVAKVLGILVLADAQQAARDRINKPWLNQERVVAFIVDEIAAYLNRLTKEFISINRQSRVCFLASHQSQGQLENSDRGFEVSFNDNLRSKISYSAPNADSGRKESMLFGRRMIFRETWSQNQSFQDVQAKDEHTFTPNGPQAMGGSMRVDEIERAWFDEQDFVSLVMGECIVSEFDGVTTLPPRKIKAPAFFMSAAGARARDVQLDNRLRRPHPVIVVRDPAVHPESRDHELVDAALAMSGYVLVEGLANAEGDLAGLKFITDAGTLVLPTAVADRLAEVLSKRLGDSQTLVVLAESPFAPYYLGSSLGVEFERVLDLHDLVRRLGPQLPEAYATGGALPELLQAACGHTRPWPAAGAWEAHLAAATGTREARAHRLAILADSRAVIDLFVNLGQHLEGVSDDVLETWHEATRQDLQRLMRDGPSVEVEVVHAAAGQGPLAGTEERLERTVEAWGDPGALDLVAAGEQASHELDAEIAAEQAPGQDEGVAADSPPEGMSWVPETIDPEHNPYAAIEARTGPGNGRDGELQPELEVEEPTPAPQLPRLLQRQAPPPPDTLHDLTHTPDAVLTHAESDDAPQQSATQPDDDAASGRVRGARGAKKATEPARPARGRNAGPAAGARRRRVDDGRLDLGFDAGPPPVPATRPPGAGTGDGSASLLSGAPID